MKKLIYSIAMVLSLLACDQNEPNMFERSDASVYFTDRRIGVSLGEILSIPINLANVGIGTPITVSIRIKDSTAVEGRDYRLISGRNYTFKDGLGTMYVTLEALAKSEQDELSKRVFEIFLEPLEGFRSNVRNKVIVELRNYSTHPLFRLLGDAQFVGLDLVQGSVEVKNEVSIYPDESNTTTLWLSGMVGGNAGGVLPDLRLEVDTLRKKITLPYQSFPNQTLGGFSGKLGTFRGFLQGTQVMIEAGSAAVFSYDKDGNILMDDWFGVWWEEAQQPLFIYYGYFMNEYHTAILKKKK